MRVLNLYAGLGGNRKLWTDVKVTAVELNPDIAGIYQDFYPDDTVIIGDAHAYLLENFEQFDFIWTSPPCPTHSQYRFNVGVKAKGFVPVYPDMTLHQEVYLLRHHYSGDWVVENTVSWYEPPSPPQKISRHYFWSNYFIPDIKLEATGIRYKSKISELEEFLGCDLSPYSIPDKRKLLRNCVNPKLGLHVFEAKNYQKQMSFGEIAHDNRRNQE